MAQQWSGQTGGTYRMQKILVSIFRYVDRRVMYVVMHLWLVWYLIVRPSTTKAIYHYHRRRGRSVMQAIPDTYRSFYHFGKAIVDRFAVYAGCPFELHVENSDIYYSRSKEKEGMIMLFSHVGNSEMAAYLLQTPDKHMNILAYGGESPVVMEQRARVLEKNNIGMIVVQPNDMSHIFQINEAMQKGEVLAIAGDRNMGDKNIMCPLLGTEAPFPAGVFTLCAALDRPVLLSFVIKESWNSYHAYTYQLSVNRSLPRAERATDLVRQYAELVEKTALQFPYQWFHFYEFWYAK